MFNIYGFVNPLQVQIANDMKQRH